MSPGRATDMVCVSRQLPELPETRRTLREGEIGFHRFRECVDPDGALEDAKRDHERRRLHLSQTLGGRWRP
jgi:hypothetical protein